MEEKLRDICIWNRERYRKGYCIINTMKYIAFVTKGLEEISKDELLSSKNLKILDIKQKFIEFNYDGNPLNLKTLKTIDDIGIYISEIPAEQLVKLDLNSEVELIKKAIRDIQMFREIENTFSITLSRYKNENVKEDEIKQILSQYFSKEFNLEYTPLNHENIDIRINITEDICLISVKLFSQSLFKRDYGHESNLGSLRSTIAGAMIYKITKGLKNQKVVDNFCGTGTLLCEALTFGNEVYGGDIDSEAVNITKRNLRKIVNREFEIFQMDAVKTRWRDNSFDIAVANFPWDKQIKVNRMYKLLDKSIQEYSRILKEESRIAFISTKPEMLIKCIKRYFNLETLESYKIGYLGQTPTIVFGWMCKK